MRLIPLFLSLSCCLTSSIAAAVTADTPINQTYNYEDSNGTWQFWVATNNGSTPSYSINSQGVVVDATIGPGSNHAYQIDANLNPNTYLYFYIPYQFALYGSMNLNASVKVEILSGTASNTAIDLGAGLWSSGFGIPGNTIRPFNISTNGQWQSVGGDLILGTAQNIQNTLKNFALSQVSDYLSYTNGPVLYINNGAASAVHLRITIDNVALSGQVASMNGYNAASNAAAQDYVSRITPTLTSLNQNITAAKSSIDNLPLGSQPTLYTQIEAEANQFINSHNTIVNSTAARTPLKVPSQAQYDQDTNNLNSLLNLANVGNYVANSGSNFLFYAWESTGKNALNEQTIGVSNTAPQQTIQAALALNELEPISVVLQNLFDSDIKINQIALGNLTNQFGELFPTDHIDTKIVKSWYVGSTTSIGRASTDIKTRTPMLLLKDDALINIDDATKTNFLRINSQGTQFYQDVSTSTAQMPNDAIADDSATLRPFTIKSMQSKQLWLTTDTRSNVRPGNYSGSINVSYYLGSDTTLRSLQIPLSFFVGPIQLQNSPLTYSVYYRAKISSGSTIMDSENKSQQQYLAEMKNMAEHGVLYPTQYLRWDTNELSNYVSLRQQAGLPCDKYYLLDSMASIGTNPDAAYNNAIQLKNTLLNSSACSNPQLYMYGIDEAQGAALDSEKAAIGKIHEAGAKSFVAGYIGTYSHLGDVLDTLVFASTPNDGEISLWRNMGKDVFSYANPQAGVPNPYIYRSHYGFLLWQHNYTGAMDYAYQDGRPDSSPTSCSPTASSYCSMWNLFQNSAYYNHEFAFPTTSGVVDTIQWEGFREAVDDTRYLATLQALVQNSTNSALTAEINNWLATIKTQSDLDPIATRKTMRDYFKKLNVAPSFSNVSISVNGTTISIAGQANDLEGYLAAVEVKLDGGTWINLGKADSWQNNFTNVGHGNHTMYYRATDYWGAVTSAQSAAIIQNPQTITAITAAPFSAIYGDSFTVAATASSGLDVTVSTSGGCSNIGNVITMTSGSTPCTVKYNQVGDANYLAAPQITSSTGASKATQAITVSQAAPTSASYGSNFSVGASASSILPVAITVTGGCSVTGNTVTMTSASTACKVNYNQAGDDNYGAAPKKSSTTTAKKGTQTISSNQPATFTRSSNMTVTATSTSGLAVTIAKYSGSCTKVSGGSGSIVMKMGALNTTCVLKYTQNGNTNYNAATNNNFTIKTTAN